MSIVRIRQCDLPPLTDEDIKRLRESAKRPIVFDEDCMPLPDEIAERNDRLRIKYKTNRITKEILIAEGYLKPKSE
ncbi:MAG: hypothetical protein IJ575_05005 [Selenomonadaceae bacterium]|nr:hypothetical protein [Selenomonadaceae bacterium]